MTDLYCNLWQYITHLNVYDTCSLMLLHIQYMMVDLYCNLWQYIAHLNVHDTCSQVL